MDTIEDEKSDRNKQIQEKRKKSSMSGGIMGGIKKSLNDYVRKKIESKIMEFLAKQKPKVKEQLRDKDMPTCVQNFVEEVVEENWPVLEEEVQYQLRIRTDYPYSNQVIPNLPWYKWIPWKIRSTIQYSVMPHNKTLGQSIKNPLWLIQTIASLCPFYGVSSFYFIFLFLIIDKSDEYQLINFILSFKRFQFFAIGLIGGFVGFYLYFYCVDQTKHFNMSVQQNCHENGPGSLIHVRIDLISFGIHLILTWIVLFFLPFSEQKGQLRFRIADKEYQKEKEKIGKEKEKRKKEREKLVKKIEEKVQKKKKKGENAQFSDFVEEYNLKQYDDLDSQEEEKKCCVWDRGGHMKFLIIWDIVMFSLSFSFFYYNFQKEDRTNFEEAKGTIYFSKWLYAILSFPFLLFSIPLISSLLSRARPTAYDEFGNTVPVLGEIDYKEDILGDIDVDAEMNSTLPIQSNLNTPTSKSNYK
ncbi:hypothetical protein ABPG74_014840 [Tetrahymena malaccensis]